MAEDPDRVRLQENVHRLQDRYREAIKEIDNAQVGELLYEVWRELCRFQADDNPSKAVYLLSRARTLGDLFGKSHKSIHAYREASDKLEAYDQRRITGNG